MIKTTQANLPDLLSELNAICQPDEHYALVRQARKQHTPAGYLCRGYYLIDQPTGGEEVSDTQWWNQAGERRFIGSTAAEANTYIRQLLKEHKHALSESPRPSIDLGDWWQARNKRPAKRTQTP